MKKYAGRKIVVNNILWYYKIGRGSVVARRAENGEKRLTNLSALTGMTWHDIEHDAHKHTFHITPKQIANWLKSCA